jgi:hypothetical protein
MRLVAAGFVIGAYTVAQAGRAGGNVPAVDGDLSTADKARLVLSEEQHEIGAFAPQAAPAGRF